MYTASCHCGDVRCEVEGEISGVEVCNCSICRRTGYVHWYVEPGQVRILADESTYATYTFGTQTARHHFCRRCGITPFRRARSDPDKVDINLRCVDGVDLDALDVTLFDGEDWEDSQARLRGGKR